MVDLAWPKETIFVPTTFVNRERVAGLILPRSCLSCLAGSGLSYRDAISLFAIWEITVIIATLYETILELFILNNSYCN